MINTKLFGIIVVYSLQAFTNCGFFHAECRTNGWFPGLGNATVVDGHGESQRM